jgi:hypothetical protein
MPDIAVQATYNVPNAGAQLAKPPHLIVLRYMIGTGKKQHNQCFIALDQPAINQGCAQAKGYFTDLSVEEVSKTFRELIPTLDKEQQEDNTFPLESVVRIKNLTFKAK